MKEKSIFILIVFSISFLTCFSQENLLSLIEDDNNQELISATFKGTKIINLQSTKLTSKKELQFMISHRFGTINESLYGLYGLDHGSIRLSLDYGLNDWLNIGLARSSFNKIIDGSIKYRLLNQGKLLNFLSLQSSPVSIVGYSTIFINPIASSSDKELSISVERLNYLHQLIFARKISRSFSMQISPTILHYNLIEDASYNHDILALGVGSRYKITKSTSINFEWIPTFNNNSHYTNSLSFGVDIETGGHVFQLMATNSTGMYEQAFIAENTGIWKSGDIHLGFNITRRFSF